MWAQLVKMRARDGTDEKMRDLERQWEDQVGRGTDSGWVRSLALRNARDPNEVYALVYFESEEKARANEQNPQHLAFIEQMMSLADGEPEYVDLVPIEETNR